MNAAMKLLLVVFAFLVACGGDPKPAVTPLSSPVFQSDKNELRPSVTLDELFKPQLEAACSTSSDCAGFGKCSGGKCGSCSTSSDCNGHGKCSGGRCGSCSTSSDCKTGTCSGGKCGGCSSSSDCKGNGKCSGGKCGSCSTSSDCKGGTCNSGRCSNYSN
jgi:hypothetical protein